MPEYKEYCAKGLGFDSSPNGWPLPEDSTWNNGMMEKWNIGDQQLI